jgi:Phosphoglycerol transferase and related proteins, alkaline phosphatase superfamily
MAYQQYIKEETAALPAYLKNDGYTTMAVHSYEKWFWNRNDVYPLIGFDSFDADIDFPDSEYRGNYISDQVAVEKVVANFENHRAQSSDPAFCFLVTMQNHGGYDNKNFPAFDVTVDAPDLSSQNQLILQNYVQGVYDADAALGQLIDYFKSNQEPTIIVMFGDHLPTLGEDYEIYRQLGFASEGPLTDADYNNLYTTPFVIWNNYDLSPNNWGTLDANLLGAAVLEDAQMNLPLYWKILLEQRENRANQNKFALFTADIIDTDRVIAETNAFNAKHWLLEYDLLFGNDYSNAFDHDILQTAIDQ